MVLSLLNVIWTYDEFIKPPGPKMVVCVEPSQGFFFRINEKAKWHNPVAIPMVDNAAFLTKDSHLECGSLLEIDDYIIDQSIIQTGVLGTLNSKHVPKICAALRRAYRISQRDRDAVLAILGCL